ncbi:aldo/keto reductase [Lacrimispora xylanisolvens]|uniref:aldo/keto reductase n=1 Tax=Lacrimispora xylanisolvens TaxID=384636 RepID=UPI00240279A8
MEYVRLGNSGLKITEITFGTALTVGTESIMQEYAENMVDTAWDLGIRSFDTSNNYGKAEGLLGRALKKYPREQYVLTTKGSWPIGDSPYHKGLSRKHILWAFENSLNELGMNYVDLYYAHRYDPEVSMEEIVRTFNYLIESGKVRYWATSEWPQSALEECWTVCEKLNLEKPITEQFIYSYALIKAEENGVKKFCDKYGLGSLGFSPLCQGYLTGKYRNNIPTDSRIAKSGILHYDKTKNFYEQNKKRIDFFLDTCDRYQAAYTAVALQWCLRRKIYPVLGASKPEQLKENIQALSYKIPEALWEELEEFRTED